MTEPPRPGLRARLLWFVLLYAGSAAAFAAAVYGFKAIIPR
ncbi:MAG TPA: hypothetical protein VHL98_17180 [Microvirga sp.]|jgi:hypothetical protein|nr:hypothetical protein [Microvirga sp.]